MNIDDLVNRFLAWPLPESVCSDQCATQKGYPHRSGTTLLTADEARQMFEYVLKDAPKVYRHVNGEWFGAVTTWKETPRKPSGAKDHMARLVCIEEMKK